PVFGQRPPRLSPYCLARGSGQGRARNAAHARFFFRFLAPNSHSNGCGFALPRQPAWDDQRRGGGTEPPGIAIASAGPSTRTRRSRGINHLEERGERKAVRESHVETSTGVLP